MRVELHPQCFLKGEAEFFLSHRIEVASVLYADKPFTLPVFFDDKHILGTVENFPEVCVIYWKVFYNNKLDEFIRVYLHPKYLKKLWK